MLSSQNSPGGSVLRTTAGSFSEQSLSTVRGMDRSCELKGPNHLTVIMIFSPSNSQKIHRGFGSW